MGWRDRYYATYVSHYFSVGRKSTSDGSNKDQFPIWFSYYGAYLPKDKGAAVLDVGCGDGSFIQWLRSRGYTNVVGIDTSPEQIVAAQKLGVDLVFEADARTFLGDHRGEFDFIVARDFIEHFDPEEVFEVLTTLYGSLRPAGTILIQTPNAEGVFGCRSRFIDFTHGVSFTRHSLGHVLKTCGFREPLFYPMRPVIHGVTSFIRSILWYITEAIFRIFLLAETGTGTAILTQNLIAFARKEKGN